MPNPFLSEIALFSFDFAPSGWAQCNGQILPINQNQALFSLLGTTYGGNGVTTFALPDLRGRVPIGAGQGPGLENYALGQKAGVETTTLSFAQLPSHTHGVNNNLTFSTQCRNSPAVSQTPVGNSAAISQLVPYTDPALMAGSTLVRAVHFTELRTHVNALRAVAGLGAFSYTNPMLAVGSTIVQAQHLLDLRTALTQAYVQLGQPAPTYTDTIVVGTTQVKAVHISELRNLVNALMPVGATYSGTADADMSPAAIALNVVVNTGSAGGVLAHDNNQPYLALRYCIALQGIFPSAV